VTAVPAYLAKLLALELLVSRRRRELVDDRNRTPVKD